MSKTDNRILAVQSTKKFLELNYEERGALLQRICFSIGVGGAISKESVLVICQDIKNKFSGIKAKEMEIAFDMSKYGELVNFKGERFQHYQALTPNFVCDILLAYYNHKNKLMASLPKKEDDLKPISPDQQRQNHEYMLKDIVNKFNEFKQTQGCQITVNNVVMEYLWNNEFIRFNEAKKLYYLSKAKEQHIKNIKESPAFNDKVNLRKELDQLQSGNVPEESSGSIKWIARMMSIHDFFKQCIEKNIEVTMEYLKVNPITGELIVLKIQEPESK